MSENKQLVRKNNGGGYNNVYPYSYTETVKDKKTGKSLEEILVDTNFLYLPYRGSKAATRLQVDERYRRKGLWIQYVTNLGSVVVEYYNSDDVSDTKWADDKYWAPYNSAQFNPGTVGLDALSQEAKDYLLTNSPINTEDITRDSQSRLQLADRTYNPASFSGKGYKILRQNILNGTNVLAQSMILSANTVYEIRYDYDLQGQEINIPEGCVLKFSGGTIKNGTLKGNKTIISNSTKNFIIDKVILSNTWLGKFYDYYDNNDNCNIVFRNCLLFEYVILSKDYILDDDIDNTCTEHNIYIDGKNNTIYHKKGDKYVIRITNEYEYTDSLIIDINNLSIIDYDFEDNENLYRRAGGIFIYSNYAKMITNFNNIKMQSRGVSISCGSSEDKHVDSWCININNCNLQSKDFCLECHNPGNLREVNIANCNLSSIGVFRPEISIGYNASDLLNHRKQIITVTNTVLERGGEWGINSGIDEVENNCDFSLYYINCTFTKFRFLNEDSRKILNNPCKTYVINCNIYNLENELYDSNFIDGGGLISIENSTIIVQTQQRYWALYSNRLIIKDSYIEHNYIRPVNDYTQFEIINCKINNTIIKLDYYDNIQSEKIINCEYISSRARIEDKQGNKYYNIGETSIVTSRFDYESNVPKWFKDSEWKDIFDISDSSKIIRYKLYTNKAIPICKGNDINKEASLIYLGYGTENCLFKVSGNNNKYRLYLWGNKIEDGIKFYIKDNILYMGYISDSPNTIPDIILINVKNNQYTSPTGIDDTFIEVNSDSCIIYNIDNIIRTDVKTNGTFSEKPNSTLIDNKIGFTYFCTDKQTSEGTTNGIMIYHKGDNVWVDALGRVVS